MSDPVNFHFEDMNEDKVVLFDARQIFDCCQRSYIKQDRDAPVNIQNVVSKLYNGKKIVNYYDVTNNIIEGWNIIFKINPNYPRQEKILMAML